MYYWAIEAYERAGKDHPEMARVPCQRIVTPRARDYMFNSDPKDRWLAGDNYDVNNQVFIDVKKTLIRLSRLAPFACDVNLWMPIASHPDKIRIVIRNVNEISQLWT